MQPTTIFEFLGGVIGGAFLSVLILKNSSHKRTRPKKSRTIKVHSLTKNKTSSLIRGETKRRRPVGRTLRVAPSTLQEDPSVEQPLLEVKTSFLSCPSCGLEAPDSLMAEHLMGSPSHRYGPAKLQTIVAAPADRESSAAKIAADESRDSVRHLLQMLVPPRAFGRRHRQRVINPLTNLVQTMGRPGRDQRP